MLLHDLEVPSRDWQRVLIPSLDFGSLEKADESSATCFDLLTSAIEIAAISWAEIESLDVDMAALALRISPLSAAGRLDTPQSTYPVYLVLARPLHFNAHDRPILHPT